MNIIQFLPYFPPHKWGVETVAEEMGTHRKKNKMWHCINIITHFEQEENLDKYEKIEFQWEVIWYTKDVIENLIVPSIEIINNFPIYKFWSKKYRLIKKYIHGKIWNKKENYRIVTHTRFFLTSLIGWLFARKNAIAWCHIEHGSDYVKLSSWWKTKVAYIYDRIFGKWIFKKANSVLAISEACKNFIQKNFTNREVKVFYRGLDFHFKEQKKQGEIKIVFIGRLVSLKWVDILIKAYKKSWLKHELIIIGDGEEKENLEHLAKGKNIEFLGFKNKEFIGDFLSKHKCILVNPSFQEWLPTTAIEWLITWNIVIATNVWWTAEISKQDDLILFNSWNQEELEEKILFAIRSYKNIQGESKEKVKEKFDWNTNITRFYNVLK